MTAAATSGTTRHRPAHPDAVGRETILAISTSLKPSRAAGGGSAAFGLISHAVGILVDAGLDAVLLDLRTVPPPHFDGQLPESHDDENLRFIFECVKRSGGLLLAAPAYWSGVSGVFKNLVDTLCGPAYDLPQPRMTVLTGKPIALLVVGADDESAAAAVQDAPRILVSTGALLVAPPLTIANPRAGLRHEDVWRDLVLLCGAIGRAVHGTGDAP